MDLRELRIGNWVYLFGDPLQLTKEYLIYFFQKDGSPEPITLTEEWLLKFGFEEMKNWGYELKIDDSKTIAFYANQFWIIPFEGPTTAYWIPLDIKYVHQLQNLFTVLTGEELVITQQNSPSYGNGNQNL